MKKKLIEAIKMEVSNVVASGYDRKANFDTACLNIILADGAYKRRKQYKLTDVEFNQAVKDAVQFISQALLKGYIAVNVIKAADSIDGKKQSGREEGLKDVFEHILTADVKNGSGL